MYTEISTENELADFINRNTAALVYFSTSVCNVCKVLKPKISDLITNNFPMIKKGYVDCEKASSLAAQNRIFTVPVIMVYFEGKEFTRKTRNINPAEFENEISRPYSLLFG